MPEYVKRTGRDVTDDILIRLRELEKRVAKQEGSPKRTSIDRGDTAAVTAPLEGQTLIQYDDEVVWYYSNGAWRKFTGAGAKVEFVSGTATVSSDSFASVSWSHVSGATVLDLTTPTSPVAPAAGEYSFAGYVHATGITTGSLVRFVWQFVSTEQVDVGGSYTQESPDTGFGATAYMNCSTGLWLNATDPFELRVVNQDSGSRTFDVTIMAVTYRP